MMDGNADDAYTIFVLELKGPHPQSALKETRRRTTVASGRGSPGQEPSPVERIEYPLSGRLRGSVPTVLRLSFPVHPALLVSFAITISIRSRAHNESLLQKRIDGSAKGLVQDHLDGVWSMG